MLNEAIKTAAREGALAHLHGVMASHRGEVIGEAYFAGEDERWGAPLGVRDHGPDVLHDTRSITKSVVSLLYGIAFHQGRVPPVDAPIIAAFDALADLSDNSERRKILVSHALSMTMGLEWDESLPYTDPRNSEIAMENAEDRYRFVFDRPIVEAPGAVWSYSGGAAAAVGRLIENGTGQSLDDFARETLFGPLGIENFEWVRGGDGAPAAASGLRMTLPDMMRVGELIAANGRWDSREIVPADWLAASFTPRAMEPSGLQYGYLWWLSHPVLLSRWVAGFGNGGQRLLIHPEDGVVVGVFAGRYNDRNAWQLSMALVGRYIYPAVRERIRAGIR